MLGCNLCNEKGEFVVKIDTGRFVNKFFYCKLHKPLKVDVLELDEKQRERGFVNEVNPSKTTKEIKKEIWEELDLIVRDKKISTRELFDNIMDITIRKCKEN